MPKTPAFLKLDGLAKEEKKFLKNILFPFGNGRKSS